MRTVILPNKKEIDIRGLTRKEMKEKKLKEYGYLRSSFKPPAEIKVNPEFLDELVDAALTLVLSEADMARLEEFEPDYTNRCWRALIAETYGDAVEIKNS